MIEDTLLGLAIAVLGIFLALFPRQLLKEGSRDDETKVAQCRKWGIVMTICGLLIMLFTQLIFRLT